MLKMKVSLMVVAVMPIIERKVLILVPKNPSPFTSRP